jgi:hypothetical protein
VKLDESAPLVDSRSPLVCLRDGPVGTLPNSPPTRLSLNGQVGGQNSGERSEGFVRAKTVGSK